MQESELEEGISNSRFGRIAAEIRQGMLPENRPYFEDYLLNVARILVGRDPIDYTRVSHGNHMTGAYFYGIDDITKNRVSPRNRITGAYFYGIDDMTESSSQLQE